MNMRHLRGAKDFHILFHSGRKRETKFFKVIALPNRLPFSRCAFIVPKSVDKRAVMRNRLRRRCREWVRKSPILFPLSLDMAITIKKNADTATRKEFYEDLEYLFKNITPWK